MNLFRFVNENVLRLKIESGEFFVCKSSKSQIPPEKKPQANYYQINGLTSLLNKYILLFCN